MGKSSGIQDSSLYETFLQPNSFPGPRSIKWQEKYKLFSSWQLHVKKLTRKIRSSDSMNMVKYDVPCWFLELSKTRGHLWRVYMSGWRILKFKENTQNCRWNLYELLWLTAYNFVFKWYISFPVMWSLRMQGKKAWLESGKWIIFVIYKL